jgi:hypothetical protein
MAPSQFDPERPLFHGLRISAISFWTVFKSIANATAHTFSKVTFTAPQQ